MRKWVGEPYVVEEAKHGACGWYRAENIDTQPERNIMSELTDAFWMEKARISVRDNW